MRALRAIGRRSSRADRLGTIAKPRASAQLSPRRHRNYRMRLLRHKMIRCKRVNDATIGADAIGAPADTAGAFIAIGSN